MRSTCVAADGCKHAAIWMMRYQLPRSATEPAPSVTSTFGAGEAEQCAHRAEEEPCPERREAEPHVAVCKVHDRSAERRDHVSPSPRVRVRDAAAVYLTAGRAVSPHAASSNQLSTQSGCETHTVNPCA